MVCLPPCVPCSSARPGDLPHIHIAMMTLLTRISSSAGSARHPGVCNHVIPSALPMLSTPGAAASAALFLAKPGRVGCRKTRKVCSPILEIKPAGGIPTQLCHQTPCSHAHALGMCQLRLLRRKRRLLCTGADAGLIRLTCHPAMSRAVLAFAVCTAMAICAKFEW